MCVGKRGKGQRFVGEQGGKGVRGVRRGAVSKPRKYLRGETRHRGRMERGNNRKSERLLQTPKGEKKEWRREKKNRSTTVPLKGSAERCVPWCEYEIYSSLCGKRFLLRADKEAGWKWETRGEGVTFYTFCLVKLQRQISRADRNTLNWLDCTNSKC